MMHRPSAMPEVTGLLLAAATWVAALLMAWLVAMAILPGSERSFAERLDATPFLDWVGPQLGLVDLLCLALASLLGWVGARSAASTVTTATDDDAG
jgi:TRAP-type C4-dicarboxylate transport system permease small subunit